MIARLWFLICGVWAAIVIWGGMNRGDGSGLERGDLWLAAVPFILGLLVIKGLAFVLFGSRPRPTYRRVP